MITLGLDPSFRAYGWAIHDSSAVGRSRRVASGHEGTLSDTVPVARFLHFQSVVDDLLRRFPDVEAVGIESPAYEASPFQLIHFGLMIFSQIPIFERRKDLVLFDPATLKLLAKEDPVKKKGVMGKTDMQRRVQLDTLDTKVIDNNEADAYLVAYYTARLMNLLNNDVNPDHLTESEKRVFLTRQKTVKRRGKKFRVNSSHVFRENSRFFKFSKVPSGKVSLPSKNLISKDILKFLDMTK